MKIPFGKKSWADYEKTGKALLQRGDFFCIIEIIKIKDENMKIYDITQELFSSRVYPGDRAPAFHRVADMDKGDGYNLTELEMNVHNGTHVDAPKHFLRDGMAIADMPLEPFVGPAAVRSFSGSITGADLGNCAGVRRLLLKGDGVLTEDGAKTLADMGLSLIGVESQSVGPANAPAVVHRILLEKGIVILEGIDLSQVSEGEYTLFAAPLKLGGSDGAPCRAVLVEGALQ